MGLRPLGRIPFRIPRAIAAGLGKWELSEKESRAPLRKRGSGDRTRHPLRRRTNASNPMLPISAATEASGTAVMEPHGARGG